MEERRKRGGVFGQLYNSKKYMALREAVVVAIIIHKIGLNLEIQFLLIGGYLTFVGIQGAMDIREAKKKKTTDEPVE